MNISRRTSAPYNEAMAMCPDARRTEFMKPLVLAGLKPGEILVDFPSGGGYLATIISEIVKDVEYRPVEHIQGYGLRQGITEMADWVPLPLESGSCDVFFILATLHHYLSDRSPFFSECHRVLRSGGRLIIGDVMAGTPEATFLETVVGRFSSQGHVARFIDPNPISLAGELGGKFDIKVFEHVPLDWVFPDKQTLSKFCRLLFRIDRLEDQELCKILECDLGIRQCEQGVALNWSLALVRADRLD